MPDGGWGSRYNGTSSSTPASSGGGFGSRYQTSSKKKKKGRHGVIGALESAGHAVEKTSAGFGHKAVGLGPGLFDVGKTVYEQTESRLTHNKAKQAKADAKAVAIAKGTAKQTVRDFTHPHGDYSGAILDALTIASVGAGSAARLAAAGRVARAGEGTGAVAGAALKAPKPEPRFVVAENGEKVEAGVYSRSASSRAVQKGADKLRKKYPNATRNAKRVGRERFQNERVNTHVANADNIALLAKKHGMNKAQELAIRVVNERVPLPDRIAKARADAAAAKPGSRVAKQLHNHIVLLERAGHYVEDIKGFPVFRSTAGKLPGLYDHAKRVANQREADLIGSGQLDAATAAARKAKASAHFGFNDRQAEFFTSYRHAKAPKTVGGVPQIGNRAQIGRPRRLEELSHEFSGESIDTGNVNPRTLEQVAVDAQRANKFLSVWRQRKELGRLAVDHKASENHIPIRPIWLKNRKWPEEIRQAINGLTENLAPEDELSRVEKIRQYIFPDMAASVGTRAKGIMWIDKRYVGDLATARTLGPAEKAARVGDKVNAPFRALTLFKPGYIPPNLANNLFLNSIHGSLGHLPEAAKLSSKLAPEHVGMIDALVGEGKVIAAGRPLRDTTQYIQRLLSNTVDLIPRRAAWLKEAKRFGYDTPEKVVQLLTDEKLRGDLRRVTREANGEMIDYGRLGPAEQALARRLIFLYPWVKGATVYGGRFLREHPIKAGAFGQLGDEGERYVQQLFGDVPEYLRGVISVGGGRTLDTAAFNNFPQATQELEVLTGLFQKNPQQALINQAQPALKAIFGKGDQAGVNVLAGPSLIRLAREAISPNDSSRKLHPESRQDALIRFLLGSAAPRKLNVSAAHSVAARQRISNR